MGPVRSFYEDVGYDCGDEFTRRVFVEENDSVNGFERKDSIGSLAFRHDRAGWAFEPPNACVGVECENEDVTERTGLLEQPDVSGMQQVVAAVSEDCGLPGALPLGPCVYESFPRFVERAHFFTVPEQPQRILVRATNWVGDAVMSLPALQVLRARFPQAHIAILARPWVADIYAREPIGDEVILYTAAKGWHDLGGKLRLAGELRAKRFDTALLLQNAFEAAALVWIAGIPRRIGYDRDGRGFLLTDAVRVPNHEAVHQRYYYLELLHRSGLIDVVPDWPAIRLHGAAEAAASGKCRFSEQLGWTAAGITGISPGAAYGSAKRWIPERFAEAAVRLQQPAAIFGSGDERALCEEVAEEIRTVGLPVHNFAGQTALREYIDLAAACSVYLTNDSGGMHIASALGVPTVAIFGATDDIATGPTGPLARVVRQPVECSPCLLRECPIDHRCMTGVPAARVAGEAVNLIRAGQIGRT